MNDKPQPTNLPGPAADDVWGVNRPPVLGPSPVGPDAPGPTGPVYPAPDDDTSTQQPYGQAQPRTGSDLDRGFAALQKAPLRRDSAHGVLGGVCAGIANKLGVSPTAVRLAAVALAMFFGSGVAAYLIAWAALPDQDGSTHAEQAVRDGRPRSIMVAGLGLVATLGVVGWILDSWWPLIAVAVVAFVVAKKKGHFSSHTHG